MSNRNTVVDQMGLQNPGNTAKARHAALADALAAILVVVRRDEVVRLPGFGTFKIKYREGRTFRNPKTGEMTQTSAKNVITFREWTGKGV